MPIGFGETVFVERGFVEEEDEMELGFGALREELVGFVGRWRERCRCGEEVFEGMN